MVSIETRTKQIPLEKWDEARKGKEKGLKGKPKRENSNYQTETKKESMESLSRLLREKPGRNVEIKVYWSGRKGKFDEVTLSRKKVEGREVFIKGSSAIEQIAMLSVKRALPESISVKTVDMLDPGPLKGELIIDTKEKIEERGFLKEFSTISNYPLADQDYKNVVLSVARELDPGYANMTLQEIGKDLKRVQGRGKGAERNF